MAVPARTAAINRIATGQVRPTRTGSSGPPISLPMLVDRPVDFITAIITSLATMRANPGIMLAWAALIATLLFLAMLPLFLGLFVDLPLLGHATWHLYRRAVKHRMGPA